MSCRCITPFSLLNAYNGPIGRCGVAAASCFKSTEGHLGSCWPTMGPGKEACPVPVFAPGTQLNSDPLPWHLPFPPFSSSPASTQQLEPRRFSSGVSGCPSPRVAARPREPAGRPPSPPNAMRIFSIFWKGFCGAQQELTLLETYTRARGAGSCGREDERQR